MPGSRAAEPLRRGPADPAAAERIRDRILDAAAECIVEAGLDSRLHADIARRAGVSRPTVYKYAGDQDAIVAALIERELGRFFGTVIREIQTGEDVLSDLIDGIALVVDYARHHELLQAVLRDHPEAVLPSLTIRSEAALAQSQSVFEKPLAQALAGRTDVPAPLITEWLFRIIVSLVIVPGSVGPRREDVRAHVAALVSALTGTTA